ncbi:DUF1501 domain-containing protein [Dactylosporangium aurantiacum]|uniref:DUF1501 domain-containing protein n=1 Tax=Dactylosporangium aurantiacum TaxID=35754 RepID=A0A9Q9ID81_9ACTN|nr:DUF1501 domain-containing protein [Dactylosporangium aurantiacum]MDG6106525.1 DUF1501 domain-containing protein [Dactylosporangium aurantiacum]UWZ50445.1 DUF1501 domain-containing protein [Dactylosporangium aurantiacum]
MPLVNPCCTPAETAAPGLSRRGLLGRAAAVGAGAALTGLLGDGLATRLAFAGTPYTGDTIVVLSLRGGFDGLSAVVPIGDPDYYTARPTIAVPKASVIAGDGTFGLHPAFAPLLARWNAGTFGAVHAVGQPNPSRSHFQAMEELERAAAGTSVRTGWLDRMLGVAGAAAPTAGVAMGATGPARAFAGPAPDVSMSSVDAFKLAGNDAKTPMAATLAKLFDGAPAVLADPARAVNATLGTVAALGAYTPAATYPATALGKALRDVARLVKANVGLMAATVDFGDWDMHEALGTPVKGQRMHDHLTELALALEAFAADLGPAFARVTLLTLSEFGRRVAENGSRGVDHGNGNAMLLLGGGVRGGRVHGTWPGLAPAKLTAGDLTATTDYRSVIGEILQRRCGLGALADVFPNVAPSSYGLVAART